MNLEKDTERWKRVQTHGGIGIPNLVLKLGQFLHTGCHCTMCKSRDVMLFMMACNIIGVSDRAKAVHYQRTLGALVRHKHDKGWKSNSVQFRISRSDLLSTPCHVHNNEFSVWRRCAVCCDPVVPLGGLVLKLMKKSLTKIHCHQFIVWTR